ncbi:LuxR C-terminal-related transcriptional regulator [Micromonospora sp. NPDC049580]|uniref:LuxR C-terminal-related transcriptional regulator n=1 Tax=Micromonospora sp. NPDC049580 TaxID=3154832 RepID=UPI003444B8D9
MTAATVARPALTTEQVALLAEIAEGRTHAAIGRDRGITRSTVEHRLSVLYQRIGARNAPHAVAIAIRAGLLPTHHAPEGQA